MNKQIIYQNNIFNLIIKIKYHFYYYYYFKLINSHKFKIIKVFNKNN